MCQLQSTASNAKQASRVTRCRRAGVVLAVSGEEAKHSRMLRARALLRWLWLARSDRRAPHRREASLFRRAPPWCGASCGPPPHRPPPPHSRRRREPPTAESRVAAAAVVVRARMCARNTHRHTDTLASSQSLGPLFVGLFLVLGCKTPVSGNSLCADVTKKLRVAHSHKATPPVVLSLAPGQGVEGFLYLPWWLCLRASCGPTSTTEPCPVLPFGVNLCSRCGHISIVLVWSKPDHGGSQVTLTPLQRTHCRSTLLIDSRARTFARPLA